MDEIEQRKENVKNYLKNNKQLIVYIALAVIILFGFYFRTFNFDLLKDVTTGKYISLELDSEIFLRYAQSIAQHGSLYSIDIMRFYPVGANLNGIGMGASYFVAYLYDFLHMFNPSITVEFVDLLYPLITMAVMSVFFFLLIRRLFNWKVALLATAIIQFIPSFLFRSVSSDHDMLAMMLIIIAFYFFVVAWQTKTIKNKIIFGAIAGLATVFGRLTANSTSFVFVVLGAFVIVEVILNKFEERDYYSYLSWIIVPTIGFTFLFPSEVGGLEGLLGTLITLIAYIALAVSTIDFLIFKKNVLNLKYKLEKIRLPEGVTSLLITTILGIIVLLILFGPDFFIQKFQEINRILFHSYSETRWTLTVAENKRPYVVEWFGSLGRIVVVSMIAGSILLFYRAVKEIDKKKYLTVSYAVFIFIYIFSRYSPSSVFNGESTISRITFYGSLLVFIGIIIYSYMYAYYKNPEIFREIHNMDKKYTFIFIWFIIMIVAGTTASRMMYEFTPIAVILASFFLISLFDYFNTRKEQALRIGGIVLLALLLFNPIAIGTTIQQGAVYQDAVNTYNQMHYMGPGYNQQWQYAGKWARENTAEKAVFAHWWDYGYWVQSGFQRATVGDGGNFIGWWNYLMGRKVLTGQSYEEALPFLYAHNVSYLLMISDEIGKYTAYSSIGSDENYDRFSWINVFGLDQQSTKETRNGTVVYYSGAFPLDEDFIYQGKVFPQGQAGVIAVKVPFENTAINGTAVSQKLMQPSVIMAYQGGMIELPLKCIFFNNQIYEFENASYDGCFRTVPVLQSQSEGNAVGAGYLLSRRTYHSNFGQLYMLNKQPPYFKVVYDDSNNMPLAIYQGRQIGPLKIWQVNYPANFSLTPEEYNYNLRLDYPDNNLLNPRS